MVFGVLVHRILLKSPLADPHQGRGCGGLVLHLCLPEVRKGACGDTNGEGSQRAELHPRQLCYAGGRGTSHGAEVCHGLSPVPAGTGAQMLGYSSVTEDHIQLAAMGGGTFAHSGL